MIEKVGLKLLNGAVLIDSLLATNHLLSNQAPAPVNQAPSPVNQIPTTPEGALSIRNPLGFECQPGEACIVELINSIISTLVIKIAPPIVAIMILYGAYQLLTGAGDEKKIESGKKTLKYVVIGYLIALLALGVSSIIKDFLDVRVQVPNPDYLQYYTESEIIRDPSGTIYLKPDVPIRWQQ